MANKYILICIPLLSFVLVTSWLIALTLEHFSGHHHLSLLSGRVTKRQKILAAFNEESEDEGVRITDTYKNVFTFIQITDIHISKFRHLAEITSDLKELCREYFPLIKPKVVIVTGDLTDAKARNKMYSQQYVDEWVSYKEVIEYCKEQYNTVWLDVKGNHDDFGIPNTKSKMNLFNEYGSSGQLFNGSKFSQYILKTDFGSYAFNGMDLSPSSGPKRPFNFFGMLNQNDIKSLDSIIGNTRLHNLTVWFGHYPLSVTATPSYLREKIKTGIAYLCGHLHTLGGLVPQMYARPLEGHLELEAGDWKENRRYRIVAIDNDLFSFVDKTFPEMPFVLITNPKDARFVVPDKEPIKRIFKSTHIRFFVFSQLKLIKVMVFIDDLILCNEAKHVANSFYVCPWNPQDFATGIHQIKISVEDFNQRNSATKFEFSLDGTTPLLKLFPGIIMLADFCFLAKFIYFTAFIIIVIWPFCIRYSTSRHFYGKIVKRMLQVTPRCIVNFAKTDHLFWPLFKFSLYLAIGPLFVGEIVPNSIGMCFAYGIYTNGIWIEESLTYIYAALVLITFNLAIMVFLGKHQSTSEERGKTHSRNIKTLNDISIRICKLLILLLCIIFQVQCCITIYICYGFMSFVLSPSATWALLLGIWLVFQDNRLKK